MERRFVHTVDLGGVRRGPTIDGVKRGAAERGAGETKTHWAAREEECL